MLLLIHNLVLLINPCDLKHALISAFGKGVGICQKGHGLRFEAKKCVDNYAKWNEYYDFSYICKLVKRKEMEI